MSGAPQHLLISLGAAATIAVATGGVLVVDGHPPPDGREAAGVFPPWWSRERVFAAASAAGSVRDLGRASFIVVVSDPTGQAPARLRRAGALFSVAPAGSWACGAKGA